MADHSVTVSTRYDRLLITDPARQYAATPRPCAPRSLDFSGDLPCNPEPMNTDSHVFAVTDANFQESVLEPSHSTPVLVDFWAVWCQPCKQLAPLLHKLVQEYAGRILLGTLNIDEERALADEAGVRSVPTVMVFRKGMVADRFVGVQPESVIREVIERNLFRESDRLLEQARQAHAQGAPDRAIELAEQASRLDPDQAEIKFELARLLVEAGRLDRAEGLIAELPREIRESQEGAALGVRIALAREVSNAPDRATLEEAVARDPSDTTARYRLAACLVEADDLEAALHHLLEIVRRDRGFRDDAGRKTMLALFTMLGGDHPLAQQYRSKMSNILN